MPTFKTKDALTPINELPDPFIKEDGSRIKTVKEWPAQREYLKKLLQHYFYGTMPPLPNNTKGEIIYSRFVYSNRAIAETVRITFGPNISFEADVIRPNKEGVVPVITWNQFKGRHGTPIEEELVCTRGYAIVEFDKEQLAEDGPKAFSGLLAKAYQGYTWGAIAMWSWGHSLIADYLQKTTYADMTRLVATGHSRGGKIALCAAIYDERFAVCAASCSGCGGAGCLRYLGGRLGEGTAICETVGSLTDTFPFWFCDEFGLYGNRQTNYNHSNCAQMATDNNSLSNFFASETIGKTADENLLPFDLHFLKALIAPRALITTEALSDSWANTFGTQITWRAAEEVFEFLGVKEKNAICLRDGAHEYQKSDWIAVADFCDTIFYDKAPNLNTVAYLKDIPQKPLAEIMAVMDWRHDKLHFSWEKP